MNVQGNTNTEPQARRKRVSKRSPSSAAENAKLRNAVDLFQSEVGDSTQNTLTTLRVGSDAKFVIPFTPSVAMLDVHFAAYSLRRYVQCNGAHCVLCEVGNNKQPRILLPVYDVEERTVVVLGMSSNCRPRALLAQLQPALRHVLADESPILLSIRKQGSAEFDVAQFELADDADDGAEAIRLFTEALDNGSVSIASVVDVIENEVLAGIPEVARILAARGLAS